MQLELPDGSYSVSVTIHPIYIYINMISNRSVFKIKDGYKLELQTPETMKLFGSTKKLIDKTKKINKTYQVMK